MMSKLTIMLWLKLLMLLSFYSNFFWKNIFNTLPSTSCVMS